MGDERDRISEEDYLEAARELDIAEREYAETWLFYRNQKESDWSATQATNADGWHFNELRARLDIVRRRYGEG